MYKEGEHPKHVHDICLPTGGYMHGFENVRRWEDADSPRCERCEKNSGDDKEEA